MRRKRKRNRRQKRKPFKLDYETGYRHGHLDGYKLGYEDGLTHYSDFKKAVLETLNNNENDTDENSGIVN